MNPYGDLTAAGPLFALHAAIAGRLRLAFPVREFTHATMSARMTPAGWAELLRRTPFVGLGWVGIRPSAANGKRFHASAQWTVALVNRNAAGPELRLLGDRHGPGQLGMIQVACMALQGLTIEDVGTVQVGEIGNILAEQWPDETGAVTAMALSCDFAIDALGTMTAGVDEYLRHVADWRLEPGDVPGPIDTIALRDGE